MVEDLQTVKPERFGRYILLDRIGIGGMAEVFRAVMPGAGGFKRMFVVKRILNQFCQSPTFVEMFVREAKLGALLNHPNIAQVYDFGNVNGEYFLALEYLRGHDLLALMRRLRETKQRFPVSVATFIAHQTALGLTFAHDLRGPDGAPLDIIHRDVTPSNIMCLGTGGVKLLDFGIAKTVGEAGVEQTEEGGFRGKLAYMSPERVRNEAFDARSDLYSLGVVLWEILTGKRLFRGKNDVDTLRNVLEMQVPPPSSLRPEIPASLDRVVARALARNQKDRYPTGQAMVDDLEPILAETTFHSRQVSQMLVELYGSGVPSSQVALACLTPELLASLDQASTVPSGAPGAAADARLAAHDRGDRRTRRRLLWGGLAAAAVLVATLGVVRTRAGGSVPHAAPPANLATTVTVLPPAILEAPAAPAPAQPAPPRDDDTETPTATPPNRTGRGAAKARGALASRRSTAPRSPIARDAIASGRSIDPFAEAAQRGGR